jgi:hypothetical protein
VLVRERSDATPAETYPEVGVDADRSRFRNRGFMLEPGRIFRLRPLLLICQGALCLTCLLSTGNRSESRGRILTPNDIRKAEPDRIRRRIGSE